MRLYIGVLYSVREGPEAMKNLEVTQWLKVLATLSEAPCLVASTHVVAACNSSVGQSSGFHRNANTERQITYIYINFF